MAAFTDSVLQPVTGVFSAIGEWLIQQISALEPLFWSSENGLTFIGVLSVCSLGVSIVFLLIHTIQNFIRFR